MSGRTFIKWALPLFLLLLFLLRVGIGGVGEWQESYLMLRSGAWSDLMARPWTLVSYSWVHSSWWHLLPSLLLLSVVIIWSRLTWQELWGLFLLGATVGGLLFYIVTWGSGATLAGASGGVSALMIAFLTVEGLLSLRRRGLWERGSWLPLVLLVLFGLLDFLTYPTDMEAGYLVHIAGYVVGFLSGHMLYRLYWAKELRAATRRDPLQEVVDKAKTSGYSALSGEERRQLQEMNM